MQVVTPDSEEGHGFGYSHVHLIGGINQGVPPAAAAQPVSPVAVAEAVFPANASAAGE